MYLSIGSVYVTDLWFIRVIPSNTFSIVWVLNKKEIDLDSLLL